MIPRPAMRGFFVSVYLHLSMHRQDCYSTTQVLEKTMMTRITLRKKIAEGIFPEPRFKAQKTGKRGGRVDLYDKAQVDLWCEKHCEWVSDRHRFHEKGITINLTAAERRDMSIAAKALHVDLEFFIREAAEYKCKQVLRAMQREDTFI